MALTLTAARHAATDAEGLCVGQHDVPTFITPEQAAAAIREQVARVPDVVHSSPLSRCAQPAALLAGAGVIRRAARPAAVAGIAARASGAPDRGEPVVLCPEDRALRRELARRLADSGGNITQVAREMGKARQQIQRWIRRFNL